MESIRFKTQLKSYIITDLNYKFDENVLPFLKERLSDLNKEGGTTESLFRSEDHHTMQLAIHKELNNIIVTMDTRVKEYIDLDTLSDGEEFEDKEFILKSLDVSIVFNFDLEYENEIPVGLIENNDFVENMKAQLERTILEICRHHMVITVKSISALDYSPSIELDFPELELDDIKII
ncbi:hypothetical protein [Paenibacillus sp. JJ-223]|uniref:hypothetical protein n=1 Tax=Paenibacillus sp. JJ-223 TaxID=2905647 RepID=UPI001F2592C7|nr:hypothetical protein [Paenibacillus sp. JJ-223]CAH1220545.1 hypothetical protein PAECIP111890_05077 [Paenibacillus sp. JJ-223]